MNSIYTNLGLFFLDLEFITAKKPLIINQQREISLRTSSLDSVLLAEGNPRLSKLKSFFHGIQSDVRGPIIREIHRQFFWWVIKCQGRYNGVHNLHSRLFFGVGSAYKHINPR